MTNEIAGLRLKGANFSTTTNLRLFTSNGVSRACLVYGKNGSGKSTISRAFNKVKGNEEATIDIAELIDSNNNVLTINEEKVKHIFIFNEDYIDSNIRLHEEGLETIVVLGEQKEIEDQIIVVKQNLEVAQEAFDAQKEICDSFNDVTNVVSPKYYNDRMVMLLKGAESWADRDGRIKGNRQASAVRNDTYTQFISRQPQKTRNNLILKYNDKFTEYEAAKSGSRRIDTHVKNDYQFLFDETTYIELLSKKLEEPFLTDREKILIGLVAQKGQGHLQEVKGYFTNEKSSTCPFCMQPVSDEHKNDLFLSIDKIINKISEEHQAELDKHLRQEIIINFDLYKGLDESLIQKCRDSLENFNKVIMIINENIYSKKENVYKPIIIDVLNISLIFDTLISSLSVLEKARLEFNKNAIDVLSKRSELKEINNDIAYYDIKDDYANYCKQLIKKETEDVKLKKLTIDLKTLKEQLEVLEIQKKNIRIAMNVINEGLHYIFFSDSRLSIEYRDDKYYLLSRGNAVTPQTISVGERNAIALCYFFTDIMKDKESSDVCSKEYLLAIDDPVSSFDIENRVGILSYLKYQLQRFLCGNIKTKALVMTHDIQSFYDIKKLIEEIMYSCKETFNTSQKYTFSINELSQQTLIEFKFKERNEYTSLMENIFDYAKETATEYELVIGNSMRRVLEAFSTFVYKKGIDTISINPRVMADIPKPYDTYFEHLMYRLVLHGGSHSEEHIKSLGSMDFFNYISSEEKKRTAKDVLCFIYLLNKVHVLEHLSAKGNVEQTIDGWLERIKAGQFIDIS